MPLDKAGLGHHGQGDLVEGFQQPFRGGLSRSAFGMACKESRDLLALLRQTGDVRTRRLDGLRSRLHLDQRGLSLSQARGLACLVLAHHLHQRRTAARDASTC